MRGMVVARIAGVGVRVRPGALLLLAAIAWLLATRLLPATVPGMDGAAAWLLGLAGAALFELGVVVHELGHALAARRAGLRADGAELNLFGGATEIEGEPRSPRDQLRIAAVGPAASLGYAAVAGALAFLFSVLGAPPTAVALAVYVAVASAAIGLVNLLPGAPLDGGRLLQALLWAHHRDRRRAQLSALHAGRWVAAALIAAGIAAMATHLLGLLGGLSVVAMGGLAWFGARDEYVQLTAARPSPEPSPAGRQMSAAAPKR